MEKSDEKLGLWQIIAEDYDANGRDWTRPGFRTLAVYRFGVWRMGIRSPVIRKFASFIYRIGFRRCRNVYGIELPYSAQLGRRVVIEHQGGIVIHGATTIGDGTIIRQGCTFGIRSLDRLDEAPTIGRNVNIGAGAVIVGDVKIGDGASVGANAVVLQDVPPGALAIGVPAKLVARRNAAKDT
jgi:serine O-acetyltransferase